MIRLSPTIQICLSTAEESLNYFTGGEPRFRDAGQYTAGMPSGIYRIVDDQLFQIVESPSRESSKKKLA